MVRPVSATLLLLAISTLVPQNLVLGEPDESAVLDACDVRVRDAPRDPLSYYCYLEAVRGGAPAEDAVRRLDAILAVSPDLHRARMILGMIEDGRGGTRTVPLLREALDGMEAAGDHHGVVYGGLTLAFRLGEQGRLAEADAAIERAAAAAKASGEAALRANVWTEQALMARRRADYGRALHLYRRAEAAVFPDGPAWLQANMLSGLGWIQWYFGDLRAAMDTYRREAEVRRASGDRFNEVGARFNLAFLAASLAGRGMYPQADCLPLADDALAAAVAMGNPSSEAHSRLLRCALVGGQEGAEECRRAIRLAEQVRETALKWSAQGDLARLLIELDRKHAREAFALVDSAIAEAREAGMPVHVAYALQRRAELVAHVGAPDEVAAAWDACLDSVEAVGKLQAEDTTRAFALSQWSFPYHRQVDLLLGGLDASSDPEADLEHGFRTMERRRARSLTELLGSRPNGAAARYATLLEVRSALGDDEIMLAYETVPEWVGLSWLLAIRRDGVEVRRLPAEEVLEDAVRIFEGLLLAGDPAARRAGEDVYHQVIDDVLEGTGDRWRTIFVVPDGPLHELPFAALHPAGETEPLGARLRIDVVPSASLWLRWRITPAPGAPPGVLALADPNLSDDETLEAFRGTSPWRDTSRPGSLPLARDEARALIREVGGNGRVLAGGEATERALKEADPAAFGVLHLAAHAVVDDARPERSAVLLAAGSETEDGLLQVSEIAALSLDGRVVILSACRGASGLRVEGEGILGLSRAFLAAGARAVLANRWPYRDDDAAAMTERIAREIGSGKGVGEALSAARRDRLRAGAPATAWAGMVLVGDGDLTVVPHRREHGWGRPLGLAVFLAILIGSGIGLRRRFRGRDA